jgi:uncharacterized cupin superfamily protein
LCTTCANPKRSGFISFRGGIAEIDSEEIDVAAGTFMAFSTPSVPHHLKNPFDQHLVYLMGGENREMEIADFPRLGKRMLRNGDRLRSIRWPMLSHLARWSRDRKIEISAASVQQR